MATPIPLHQPTQYPSTLALVAVPSSHRLVHHMCAHHTLSHQPLWACMHPISTITHLPFDCHRLCTSPSYFGPLPTQFHPSHPLLSTFHTTFNFCTHTP